MSYRDYPVGTAQQIILDALNLTATGHKDADNKFKALGLVVASQRQGRRSVPAITVLPRQGGGFNAGGDGDEWTEYDEIDTTAIEQWIVKK